MRVKTVRFFVEQIHMWPHMVHVHVHVVHIHDIRMVYNIYIYATYIIYTSCMYHTVLYHVSRAVHVQYTCVQQYYRSLKR